MRSDRSHRCFHALLAPTVLTFVVAVDCSVDRSGLGGGAGITPVMVGAGGDSAGTGGIAGSGGGRGDAGSSGTSGGNAGSGATAAGGDGGSAGSGGALGPGGSFAGGGGNEGGPDAADDGGDRSDAPLPTAGCADGTREAFTDEARFPSIA